LGNGGTPKIEALQHGGDDKVCAGAVLRDRLTSLPENEELKQGIGVLIFL